MKSIKYILILLNILFFTQNNAIIPIRYENSKVTFVLNIPNIDNNSANLEIIRDISIKKPSIIYKELEFNKPLIVNQNEISPNNEKFETYRLTFSINQKKFNSLGFITQDVLGKTITFSTKTASSAKCSDELENLLPDKLNGLDTLKMNVCVNIDDSSKNKASDKISAVNFDAKQQANKVKFVLNIPKVDNNKAYLTITTRDKSAGEASFIMKELDPNKILIVDRKEIEPNNQKADSYRLRFSLNKKQFNSIGDLPKDLFGKKITFSIKASSTEKCTDIIPNLLADFQPNVCVKVEDDIQK